MRRASGGKRRGQTQASWVFDWQSAESAGGQSCGHFIAIDVYGRRGNPDSGRFRRTNRGWWVPRDPPQPGRWSLGTGGWAPGETDLDANGAGCGTHAKKGDDKVC